MDAWDARSRIRPSRPLSIAIVVAWFAVAGAPLRAGGQDTAAKLVVWNWVSSAPAHPDEAAAVANQNEFLKRFPWIDVNVGGGPQLQRFGRGTQEFLMAQAGGIAPDVVEMSDVDLQDFISRHFLSPLDDYLRETGQLEQVLKDPLAMHFVRNGHVYALPASCFAPKPRTFVLVYRKDLFRRVGLDPEKPPATWKELLEYSERLTDPSQGRVGLVLPTLETRGMGAGAFIELVLALNGVKAITPAGDGEWKADFASDGRALEAMELVRDLIGTKVFHNGRESRGVAGTSLGLSDDPAMLADARAAMIVQQIEELNSHISRRVAVSDLGVALLPLGPSGQARGDGFVPMFGRFYLGVNALSPSERRRTAAQWVLFNQRPDLASMRIQAYVEGGWTMFLDPRDLLDRQHAGLVSDIPRQWQQVWQQMMSRAAPLPMCGEHRRLRQDYLARPLWALLSDPDTDLRELLVRTERAINEDVFGKVPPTIARRRQSMGTAAVAMVAAAMLIGGWFLVRGMMRGLLTPRSAGSVGMQAGRGRSYFIATLMMLPALLSVLLWAYLPLARGSLMAFQDYQIAGVSRWVGLENFIAVLTDRLFWISIWRTVEYSLIMLTLGFAGPIVLAFLLSEVPRWRMPLRVIYCLPAMTSSIVLLFIWKWMYDPTEQGFFNSIIATVGSWFGQQWGPLKWLHSERLAMISVALPSVWAAVGVGSIIYLAALHSVPDEMYEAADLDGAGVWSKIWNIALPHIWPLLIINFVGAVIGTFQAMQNVFVTTGGGPGDATYLVGLYIFINSFVWLRFGHATAAAWIIGSLLIGFTLFQLRVLQNLKFRAAGAVEPARGR